MKHHQASQPPSVLFPAENIISPNKNKKNNIITEFGDCYRLLLEVLAVRQFGSEHFVSFLKGCKTL